MTRTSNTGVGPCVNRRAEIINAAHADVAVDIHADGAAASGRGFTILEPMADGPNDAVIAASQRFGGDVRQAMLAETAMPESNYEGSGGIMPRDDLAGLNLTTVPKVLIECGNMRNAVDAGLLVTARFQQQVASALTAAIVRYLRPACPAGKRVPTSGHECGTAGPRPGWRLPRRPRWRPVPRRPRQQPTSRAWPRPRAAVARPAWRCRRARTPRAPRRPACCRG